MTMGQLESITKSAQQQEHSLAHDRVMREMETMSGHFGTMGQKLKMIMWIRKNYQGYLLTSEQALFDEGEPIRVRRRISWKSEYDV